MNVENSLSMLKAAVLWIDNTSSKIPLPSDRRSQIASGCFDVALEHQAAIALLCQAELYGSMLALFRVIAESVVRGLWILHCASDEELNRYENGKIKKTFGELIEEVETQIGATTNALSQMKADAWNAMNGFTHTGYIQVTRRHGEGQLGANYPAVDIVRCLNAVGTLGLIASGQLVAMAARNDLVDHHFKKMQEYAAAC